MKKLQPAEKSLKSGTEHNFCFFSNDFLKSYICFANHPKK